MAIETSHGGRARIFAALLCLPSISPAYALRDEEPVRPIIAELVANPAGYDGRKILIYGLVVGTEPGAGGFYLQDVSQHPILVVKTTALPVSVGDELEIMGTFERRAGEVELRAERITPSKVLGGGGCC